MSADEAVYAGEPSREIFANYLYLFRIISSWLISPNYFDGYGAHFSILSSSEFGTGISESNYDFAYYLRPTINLKKDVKFTGTGTSTDPYKIVSE